MLRGELYNHGKWVDISANGALVPYARELPIYMIGLPFDASDDEGSDSPWFSSYSLDKGNGHMSVYCASASLL